MKIELRIQTPDRRKVDRKHHVWLWRGAPLFSYKCCLCGAVSKVPPPVYPEPAGWLPSGYEPLTPDERAQCPPE